jgi:sugar phosphate permease
MMQSTNNKSEGLIVFLAIGLTAIYGFPNMKIIFYSMVKNVLNLTDTQVGMIFAVFGTVALCSYVFGGIVVDKLSLRTTICGSLLLAGILHLMVSFCPTYHYMLIISACMSVSSIFMYFPTSSKLIGIIGNAGQSGQAGKLFGLYYALEALFTLGVNYLGKSVLSVTGSEEQTFSVMTRSFGTLCFCAAIFLYRKVDANIKSIDKSKFSFSILKQTLATKNVWLMALMTCGAYVSYIALSYIPGYLSSFHGIKGTQAITLSIIRVNVMTIIASLLIGRLTEKRKSTIDTIKLLAPILATLSVICFLLQYIRHDAVICIVFTMAFAFVVLGIKAISISSISEMEIPVAISGSIIGVVSFIGYSPDSFYYAIMGRMVDSFGDTAYSGLWIISFIGALICCICAKTLLKSKVTE